MIGLSPDQFRNSAGTPCIYEISPAPRRATRRSSDEYGGVLPFLELGPALGLRLRWCDSPSAPEANRHAGNVRCYLQAARPLKVVDESQDRSHRRSTTRLLPVEREPVPDQHLRCLCHNCPVVGGCPQPRHRCPLRTGPIRPWSCGYKFGSPRRTTWARWWLTHGTPESPRARTSRARLGRGHRAG
jgi:hypothetical protein